MKIRHKEIEIKAENPFANCKLDRKQYADILSDIVITYAEGFVLAINNEWGTGKTTFVKMWKQDLENCGFQTIYFNAWENDFDNNPLVAIMSELKTLTNNKNEIIFKSVVEKGAILARNVLPALVKSVVKTYTGINTDTLLDGVENFTAGVTEIFEKEISEYTAKKKTVVEFKNELEKFIKKSETQNPLIFIIDELDRCRPDYAVDVLEQVKHFFSVSGIVFVLSIDKKHLASSIKGYYGSDDINTDEYLRRFIDLEYSIPKPSNTKSFCAYLYDYYHFADFFASDERKTHKVFENDGEMFLKMAVLLFDNSNLTLRQQEKIFALSRLVLSTFYSTQHTFSSLLFVLVYTKTMKNQIYEKLKTNIYELQELCDIFEDLLVVDFRNHYGVNLYYVVALLLQLYNNNREHLNQEQLLIYDADGKRTSPIKSKFEKKSEWNDYASSFEHIYSQRNYNDLKLDYLLNKIDLMISINK